MPRGSGYRTRAPRTALRVARGISVAQQPRAHTASIFKFSIALCSLCHSLSTRDHIVVPAGSRPEAAAAAAPARTVHLNIWLARIFIPYIHNTFKVARVWIAQQ